MIQKIKEWSGVIALVAIVLLLVLQVSGGGKKYGAILDTSYFDFFNATTAGGFQINGTTVLSSSLFSLPSGVTKETINGVTTYTVRNSSLNTATTTPCALQGPNATTTIESSSYIDNTGTTTASLLTMATSTTAFATTSKMTSQQVASGAQGLIEWHPGASNSLLPPLGWIVVGQQGGVSGSFSPTGTCNAVLRSVN